MAANKRAPRHAQKTREEWEVLFTLYLTQRAHDAVTPKEIFNEADISTMLWHIGINQGDKDELIKDLTFKHGRK